MSLLTNFIKLFNSQYNDSQMITKYTLIKQPSLSQLTTFFYITGSSRLHLKHFYKFSKSIKDKIEYYDENEVKILNIVLTVVMLLVLTC